METEPTDLSEFDHDTRVARKGIEQSHHNHEELFRQLGLLSYVGHLSHIDADKLYEFLLAHNLGQENH